ncbi:MAG: hypothetical protein WCG23_05885 [bacterium]
MTKEAIQKEIDLLRDVKNHLWNVMIVSFGGALTLMFNLTLIFNINNLLKLMFCIAGFIFGFIFLNGYFKNDDKIYGLIEKLNKDIL